jgi:hypothetical protein
MSLQLSSTSSGTRFPQQGTVDWGQLASSTVAFTVDVLSRFSPVNVDIFTLEVGRVISRQFEISSGGRDNVISGLNRVVSYGFLGDVLWFSFGSRHIVRAMPLTSEGLTCLALCGVLSEYYVEKISPEILHELVKSLRTPPQFTPSVLQWKALIRGCAGVFAKTSFGTLLEQMIQLNPYARCSTYDGRKVYAARGGFATPRSIQKPYMVLVGSPGEIKSLSSLAVEMMLVGLLLLQYGCLIFVFEFSMQKRNSYFKIAAMKSHKLTSSSKTVKTSIGEMMKESN